MNQDDARERRRATMSHMTRVGVRELRRDASAILRRVAAGETDWRKVIASLTGEIPGGKDVFYQKHMAHHLLPEVDRGWLSQVTHAFLIRSPGNVIASLARKLGHPPQLGDQPHRTASV